MSRRLFSAILAALVLYAPSWAADLVYLNTRQGEERLVGAQLRRHFFAVQPYVESQQNLAFCGPASIAAVLNSLEIPRPAVAHLYPYPFFTQDNIFTPATQRIKSYIQVASQGLTLAEITAFLNALGVQATPFYADRLTLERLRRLLVGALANPEARVIVNYSRTHLGQDGGGHFSPLAAYAAASDAVLLLDVAKFESPPVWVALTDLLAALQTTDPDSGKYRGLVIVEKAVARPSNGAR